MPSDRGTVGEAFNNTYSNGTLVGNWLEDRLQGRAHKNSNISSSNGQGAALNDGLLGDPRITCGRNASQVRQDLMRTTYDVDYNRNGGVDGGSIPNPCDGGVVDKGGEQDGCYASAHQSVLQVSAGAAPSSVRGGGISRTNGKDGVHRVLLFSKDPVNDLTAALPVSTNTDTYGAFPQPPTRNSKVNGNNESTNDCADRMRNTNDNRNITNMQNKDERSLYDSVTNAKACQKTASVLSTLSAKARGGLAAASAATGMAFASVFSTTTGFASLAVPTAAGSDDHSEAVEDENDARWCTSKQAADAPVEHYVFQRRLPPVRM